MVAVDKPGISAQEAAAINAAAVTRNYAVKPRLRYQTVSAVSGIRFFKRKTDC
jgi:V-type H+-transporting ATPase subunit B